MLCARRPCFESDKVRRGLRAQIVGSRSSIDIRRYEGRWWRASSWRKRITSVEDDITSSVSGRKPRTGVSDRGTARRSLTRDLAPTPCAMPRCRRSKGKRRIGSCILSSIPFCLWSKAWKPENSAEWISLCRSKTSFHITSMAERPQSIW